MSAPERAVEPAAGPSRSRTSVSTPRSARWKATLAPTTPAPTTMASGTRLQAQRRAVEAGDAALHRRVTYGVGDLFVNARVEYRGDEVFVLGEGARVSAAASFIFTLISPAPASSAPRKDAGVAQDVVHARPVSGEG